MCHITSMSHPIPEKGSQNDGDHKYDPGVKFQYCVIWHFIRNSLIISPTWVYHIPKWSENEGDYKYDSVSNYNVM